ncbi:hypothetical protein MLD38_000494 [Melastoma candidum]|uniref:Uncharacterized protein n=1 Tax=Melastoma candidum TaxID=119954 RepID=A0ACB9SC77_9MYRT|nr:hypothetical protein MLD38_000494 [Melastoma candidum]
MELGTLADEPGDDAGEDNPAELDGLKDVPGDSADDPGDNEPGPLVDEPGEDAGADDPAVLDGLMAEPGDDDDGDGGLAAVPGDVGLGAPAGAPVGDTGTDDPDGGDDVGDVEPCDGVLEEVGGLAPFPEGVELGPPAGVPVDGAGTEDDPGEPDGLTPGLEDGGDDVGDVEPDRGVLEGVGGLAPWPVGVELGPPAGVLVDGAGTDDPGDPDGLPPGLSEGGDDVGDVEPGDGVLEDVGGLAPLPDGVELGPPAGVPLNGAGAEDPGEPGGLPPCLEDGGDDEGDVEPDGGALEDVGGLAPLPDGVELGPPAGVPGDGASGEPGGLTPGLDDCGGDGLEAGGASLIANTTISSFCPF